MSNTNEEKTGICYIVGAGPGDPGLMTLRGKECVEMADVLVYDYLANHEFLKWAKPDAELVYAGKNATHHAIPQDGINELLVEKVKEGKVVTRLKGGDPLLFGRGGEEAEELVNAGVAFELVPGISSAIAGPAYAGIPVTHRDHCSQLTIFTGHEDPTKAESSMDYAQIAKAPGTKVMLMAMARLRVVMDEILKHGADPETPVAMVRWATRGNQESITGTIATIADVVEKAELKSPTVCVIGDVVNCREKINWFENRPLFGKRVVVTRTQTQASGMSRQLRELGADVMEIPTIRIQKPEGEKLHEFAELVQDCHKYDWLIFTSSNGVVAFFEMFYKLYDDARSLGGARIAAVGPGTVAKLKEYHVATDLMPKKYVGEEIANTLKKEIGDLNSLMMLWIRGEDVRPNLQEKLNEMGAILDECVAYSAVPEMGDPTGMVKRFQEEGADIVTFTSASTVEGFLDLGLDIPERTMIASIGPITSEAIEENQMVVDVESEESTIPSLVDAVLKLAKG